MVTEWDHKRDNELRCDKCLKDCIIVTKEGWFLCKVHYLKYLKGTEQTTREEFA